MTIMIYKNCDGKKIDKCMDCKKFIISPLLIKIKIGHCPENNKNIPNINIIPDWCPLEDYNEKR